MRLSMNSISFYKMFGYTELVQNSLWNGREKVDQLDFIAKNHIDTNQGYQLATITAITVALHKSNECERDRLLKKNKTRPLR